MKIYGPYTDSAKGRRFIIVSGVKQSYAKYLMEQHLGRKLLHWEEIHHRDNNKLNDTIENLEIKHETIHRMFHKFGHTYQRGAKGSAAKLTEIEVKEIRELHATGKFLQKELATKYKVAQAQISRIINKRTWI